MRRSFLSNEFERTMLKSMASSRLKPKSMIRRPKRFRSTYTTEQINYLETQFKKFPYITREHRKEVAAFLKMDERPVKIWFQNRRMREKKDKECESSGETGNNSPQEFKDQLFVRDVPTTNGLRSYSLLTMSSTFDATDKLNPNSDKLNIQTNAVQLKVPRKTDYTINQAISQAEVNYKETNYRDSFHFHHKIFPSTSETKNKTPSQNKQERPSRVEKRYRHETTTHNNIDFKEQHLKMKSGSRENIGSKKNTGEIFVDKKPKVAQRVAPIPKNQNVRNPTYCPVIPTVYSPQFLSSDVIWRPVNIMPMFASAPNDKSQEMVGQNKCCKCKCHENIPHLPTTFSQNLQKPYAQYVISVPFHNPTSKM